MESLLREGEELHSNKEVDFILSTQGVIVQESRKLYFLKIQLGSSLYV